MLGSELTQATYILFGGSSVDVKHVRMFQLKEFCRSNGYRFQKNEVSAFFLRHCRPIRKDMIPTLSNQCQQTASTSVLNFSIMDKPLSNSISYMKINARNTHQNDNVENDDDISGSSISKDFWAPRTNDDRSIVQDQKKFDMKKPIFDLYSLRFVRGDALAKYNTRNQSEPLRINLLLLLTLSLLCSSSLAEDVIGLPLTFSQAIGAVASGIISGYGFVRECSKRLKQLNRIERELEALDLTIRLPTLSRFANYNYEASRKVGESIAERSARIVVIAGSPFQVRDSMLMIQVLRNRLVQANTYIVPILMSNNKNDIKNKLEWVVDSIAYNDGRPRQKKSWLAEPGDREQWVKYIQSLNDNKDLSIKPTFCWFGLSSTGRSFGSGTQSPSWIQVLGKSLSPQQDIELYRNDDSEKLNNVATTTSHTGISGTLVNTNESILLGLQAQFYNALTTGNITAMKNNVFYAEELDEEVSAIIGTINTTTSFGGGRLDSWELCLSDGSYPSHMKIGDSDVTIISDTEAYTTAIEYPSLTNTYSNSPKSIPTLLAIQKWKKVYLRNNTRNDYESRENDMEDYKINFRKNDTQSKNWVLVKHQTIPWSKDTPAAGTLLCDCRGCVSLV